MELKILNKKTLAVLIGIVLVVFIIVALSASTKPSIIWSPETLGETVSFEKTSQTNISFTSGKGLGPVVVQVNPELGPFVSLFPSEPFEVVAGETYTVIIDFSLESFDTLGLIDGTIQVQSANNPDNIHTQPLPIQLDLLPFGLPPDPGEAGKQTLEGIDSDGDGLRDDIQRWIAFRHPSWPEARASLRQYAMVMQANLLRTKSVDEAVVGAREVMQAHNCLDWTFPDWEDAEKERTAAKQVALDTKTRTRAFLDYDALLSGRLYTKTETVAEDCTEKLGL